MSSKWRLCFVLVALGSGAFTSAQTLTTVAGNGNSLYSGDNIPATSAAIGSPIQLGRDTSGNLYIADVNNSRIRKVDAATGIITTVAGGSTAGGATGGDGGPATSAKLENPCGVKLDAANNIYILESCVASGGGGASYAVGRLRKVDATTGVITTIAGGPAIGSSGDGGPASAARLYMAIGIAIDTAGNIFVADFGNHRVRRIDAATQVITTVAGLSMAGYWGDGGPATSTALNGPTSVALDAAGDLYIADYLNVRIRKVDAVTGIITTVAGTGVSGFSGDGIPATSADINQPLDLALDAFGNIYYSDAGSWRVRKVEAATGLIRTVASNLPQPGGLLFSTSGDLYISERQANRVRLLTIPAPPSISLSVSPASVALGQTVTLTATLPTNSAGTVSFYDGSTLLGTGFIANGFATYVTSTIPAGTHPLTAQYGTATSLPVNLTVQHPASLSLASSANPIDAGQSITFWANVTPSTATGTVQFKNGATVLATVNLVYGSADLTTSTLPVGSHSIVAVYSGDALNSAATSPTVSQVVRPAVSVSLVSSANPAATGQSITFTANVTPSTATGTVQFNDGATVRGTANLVNGVAALTTSTLNAGSRWIEAVYSGDAQFSTARSMVYQVVKTAASVSLVSSANPAATGQSITFTANVTPSTATGTVQFNDGATVLGTVNLVNGVAALTASTLNAGSHPIVATYSGDAENSTAMSSTVSQVMKTVASVSLVSSVNPAAISHPITFTSNVTPSTATGTVQFIDGATVLGTVNLVNGIAALTTSTLNAGSHSIVAVYSGDALNSTATSPTVSQLVKAGATVSFVSSANPAATGQSITFTSNVTPSTATGTVQFKDGATVLGTVNLVNGSAALTTSTLTAGSHPIVATYSGDALHSIATSATVSEVVKTVASVSLGSSANPAATGQSITFTSNITPSTATGTVQFKDGATVLGTVNLVNGSAPLTTSTLAAGSHSIVATYSGDAQNTTATSSTVSQAVNAPALACKVVYSISTQWNMGFTAGFTIQNIGTTVINPWTMTFTWPGNQQVTQAWNSSYTQSGQNTTFTAASWNRQINPGATLSGMGFNASYSGTNVWPTAFFVNGVRCQ